MRVGLLGGTFDPPHLGHLHLARIVLDRDYVDEVMLIPAYRNPLKGRKELATPKQRWEMCQIAIENEPGLSVSDIELTRGGPSYMVETVEELMKVRAKDKYFVIIGADTVRTLDKWYRAPDLANMVKFLAFDRDRYRAELELKQVLPDVQRVIQPVEAPTLPISSSKIRSSYQEGRPAKQHLPPGIHEYIERSHLYR